MKTRRTSENGLFFFSFSSSSRPHAEFDEKVPHTRKLWAPVGLALVPAGAPLYPFLVWTVFHHLVVFNNSEYCLWLVYSGGALVHRATVTPGYFRFPFMGVNDLQIGDVWTHSGHRGKGLATMGLKEIVSRKWKEGRVFWYVVDRKNIASIRVAEKAGFVKVAEGVRTERLGLGLLGAYEIRKRMRREENSGSGDNYQ